MPEMTDAEWRAAESRDPAKTYRDLDVPWHRWFPWITTTLAIIVALGWAWTLLALEAATDAYTNRPHLAVDYFIRD